MGEEEGRKVEDETEDQAAKQARAEKVRQRKEEMRTKAQSTVSEGETQSQNSVSNANLVPKETEKASLREDLIASSVNFLNHPRVKSSPSSQKTAFLEKKGLTKEEIQEAFRRVGDSSSSSSEGNNRVAPVRPSNNSYPQQQQGYYPPAPYPPPQIIHQQIPREWYQTGTGLALVAIGAAGIGAGMLAVAKAVIPYFTGENIAKAERKKKKREKAEEKKANDAKAMEDMANSIKAMQEKNDALQENIKSLLIQQSLAQSAKETKEFSDVASKSERARLAETEAELKKIKAMLVDRSVSSSLPSSTWSLPTAKPTLPAWQMASSSSKTEDSPSFPLQNETKESAKEEIEEKQVEDNVAPQTPPTESVNQDHSNIEQASNSSKFEEIMNLVKEGKIPDDVKNIDDKPRDPNQKIEKGTREAPAKPWAKRS